MEQWKTIQDMPNYEVSDLGNVRNIKKGRLMTQYNVNGYSIVGLNSNGKQDKRYVHRLVATAFLGEAHEDKEVNHKDGNRTNNCVENLEWVTPSENIKHGYREIDRKPKGAKRKYGINNNMRINLKLFRVERNMTQEEFADEIGIGRAMYSKIERGDCDGSLAVWMNLQRAFNVPNEEMFNLMLTK